MVLFMLLGIPLSLALLAVIQRREGLTFSGPFLRGMLAALPALLVIALLRGMVGVSYRPFLFYLVTLYRLHLLGFILALGASFLFWGRQPRFQPLIFFLGGFYTVLTFADLVGSLGHLDGHHLFLLPMLRVASILFAAGLYSRLWEESGWGRVLAGALVALVPLTAAVASYLFLVFRQPAAIAATLLYLAGSLAFLVFYERIGARLPNRG